ncbi:septum site-determining protein MinC [Anaerocolumna aminovalerica]|jgi:septum site-determining protein MinC|uniref:Probable septum site-determining protein MinC n=1 Tax=Anaerocolumna aminovalerica TaxID=1527 RepID=A0A1I5CJ19_9FIRM|nr:septum site-determining protein MinC [Anaerocolumna aminovalerica]MDU6264998.1 septum site-determining protein MinC [Anaerocolumna aminovalerica]SFN86897.1 septum site-determining protein MinC [Anaerocolumna aminovalerica]
MNNPVIIKGNKYGIVVVLDAFMKFDELKEKIAEKFRDSSKFFSKAQMAISFEGRALSNEEQRTILDIIAEETELHVVCVVENDPQKEEVFKKALDEKLMELSNTTGQFYKGNLRSGQVLESETSIIVIGDVNPGARIVSKGNIIVLGSLKGTVFAGATGNSNSFVVALDMNPVQIRIADTIARSPDKPIKEAKKEAKIAFFEDGNIYIETLNKEVLNDINL